MQLSKRQVSHGLVARQSGVGRGVRYAVEVAVWAFVAMTLWRTWFLEGLPVSFMVTGGSMAQTLLGTHRNLVCGDCGFPFVCGCDRPTADPRAVCPNCGYAGNAVGDWPELPGDRVLVHRAMYQLRAPRRWEVIAFRTPGRERDVSVKRVVGLPGESVEIRDGRVYINGQLARKTFRQQQATSILVYDAGYAPHLDPPLPPRWTPDSTPSRWSCEEGRFNHPGSLEQSPVDWLTYHHWRRVPGQPGTVLQGPVLTETSHNQGHRVPGATIHPTADVRLSLRLARASGAGRLWVRATNGAERFQVCLESGARRIDVSCNGQPLETPVLEEPVPCRRPLQIDVSLFDRQLLVALDGRTVFVRALETPAQNWQPSAAPFAVGAQGLAVELDHVRVFRDISYDTPDGRVVSAALAEKSTEEGGEFFVLGDNAPISEDSRIWPTGRPLTSNQLLGKPLLVCLPTRWGYLGGWCFRIPDISAIRYIR